jgi:hypothetical protein
MTHLKKVFKSFFTAIQDHLELLVIANVGWFILCAPFILLQVYWIYFDKSSQWVWLLSWPALLIIPMATAGLCYLIRIMLLEPDAGLKDFMFGLRKYALKSLGLCFFDFLLILILAVNLIFYLKLLPGLSGPFKYFILIVVGLMIWGLAFLFLLQLYLFPVMVSGNASIVKVFRESFILMSRNLLFSIIITAFFIFMGAVWIISGLGVLCFLGSTAVLLGILAMEELNKQTTKTQAL